MKSINVECPFCRIVSGELPAIIVSENKDMMAIMDLFPATLGHVLVIPKQHFENIYSLPEEIGASIMTTALKVARALKNQLQPVGLNLIQANGIAAGQTIGHFHLHLVPRYEHDAVILEFGHGAVQADTADLQRLASKIKSGMTGFTM